jgi:hypothetical protein
MPRVRAKFVIRRTACARAQFSGCSSTTNVHNETGQMACCQNMTLGALSSRSALSLLVGALFKKFGLFLNRVVCMCIYIYIYIYIYEFQIQNATKHYKEGL